MSAPVCARNAGEIAFDRLLIEQLGPARVTVAVRGGPVINDATRADARAVGLHEISEIIDNGSDAPGTLLDDCSQEFKRCFIEADLILAKGQGNFEMLSDEPCNIFSVQGQVLRDFGPCGGADRHARSGPFKRQEHSVEVRTPESYACPVSACCG